MFSFNEWINEGRRPVFVGGAFGKKPPQKGGYSHSREQQSSLQGPNSYQQRVAFGLTQEDKIMDALRKNCNINLEKSTDNEDKYDKIDAWWSKDGARIPISIKYRDSGNDLLFEVIKPFTRLPLLGPHNQTGRDVKPPGKPANQFNPSSPTGAKYLLHLNKEGTLIKILDLEPCYREIYNMMQNVDKSGWSDPARQSYREGSGAMLRWQRDGSSGVQKVVAYLPPAITQPIFQCKVNIHIG